MAEIIIIVLLQLGTILNGGDSEKGPSNGQAGEKDKQEEPIKSKGGGGNWYDIKS